MYSNLSFGKTLLKTALVFFAFAIGGAIGYVAHIQPPPVVIGTPAHVSQALAVCMTELDALSAQAVAWGDWAEIASR